MDETIGTFFPYYAKQSKPKLFDLLMHKQNFAMTVSSAIPIFGFTQQAQDYELEHNGMEQNVQSLIWQHPNILAIKPTASTTTLGKYVLLVDREFKEEVEEFLDTVFERMPEMETSQNISRNPSAEGNLKRKIEQKIFQTSLKNSKNP
jgi:hypothetical protein